MNPQCVTAVGRVLGREPTEAEIRNIEGRLAKAMRQEAARDPQAWLGQPIPNQLRLGARRAAQDLLGEAALKKQRVALQVLATARMQRMVGEFPGTPMEAIARLLAFHADAKGSVMSVETRANSIEKDALRQMIGTLEATNPSWLGLFEDADGMRALIKELHGEATGNKDAANGAAEFKRIAETLRQRFNRAGGEIGQLDDWGMPHHHSQLRVAEAGKDKWVRLVMPMLNRSRYVDERGRLLSDAEVEDFLGEAWTTIATGGANKIEPGKGAGSGMRANRGNVSRQVHFKDADAYIAYQADFGERSLYEVLVGHIKGAADDLALVEVFGPNPDLLYRQYRDHALRAQALANPAKTGKAHKEAIGLDNLYNIVAGKSPPVADPRLARFFDNLRSSLVTSRLGSAFISSFSDEGTMRVTAHVNNLPQMRLFANEMAALNPANLSEKRLAMRAGLALNTMVASLNRFGNDHMKSNFFSKLGTATLRASGLNAITEARRRAFGVTYMSALGEIAHHAKSLDDLDADDFRILKSKGITETEFEVWRQAKPEDWGDGNDKMLTPAAIYRIPDAQIAHLGNPTVLKEQAATRLLGTVLEETDMAIIEPGARERALMQSHLQRGTWKGELTRSFFLFKSFPLAMITKHWTRGFAMKTPGGSAAYLASTLATTTVLGLLALQASQVVAGKDPRDMTDWRTWVQAVMKGGALSLFGDFLFSDQTQHGQSVIATTLGPVAGLAEDVIKLTQGNVIQAAQGKETHAGAETVKFVRSNLPGANLWYSKAVMDHLFFHKLQEYLSPGYLDNMRERSEKEFGQSWWWEPGETLPDRAPDLEAAVGER